MDTIKSLNILEGPSVVYVNIFVMIFSCDSSSISRNVGRSVGLSVSRSVGNEFYRSVMLLLVYKCCVLLL